MKNLLVNIFLVFTLLLMLLSCSADKDNPGVEYAPNMYHSTPYEPLSQVTDKEIGSWLDSNPDDNHGEFYNSNPYNPYGMTMRDPVPNTVKRSSYLPYRIPKDSLELAAFIKNPLASTEEVLKEGKVLYTRYCIHCHGEKGMGDGLVGIAYKGVTAYNSRAVKNKSEGEIFHVITHGKGRMWAHGSQVSIENRWKIVKYVQTLQKQ
jgi:mono/diheme cytochrome c family protein|tara:strand:- start:780 stop:1397 length:618 start_codon:yes stop_codon:yes gene_type:complete